MRSGNRFLLGVGVSSRKPVSENFFTRIFGAFFPGLTKFTKANLLCKTIYIQTKSLWKAQTHKNSTRGSTEPLALRQRPKSPGHLPVNLRPCSTVKRFQIVLRQIQVATGHTSHRHLKTTAMVKLAWRTSSYNENGFRNP